MADIGHQWTSRAFVEGSRQMSVVGVAIAFMIITAVVVGLRMWVRIYIINGVSADDYLMLAGTAATFSLSIANIVCAYYGAGVHLKDINPDDAIPLAQSNYANAISYFTALGLVKCSILVFYLRLDHRPLIRWSVYATMVSVIALETLTVFLVVFECKPIQRYWDPSVPGTCMDANNRQKFYNANGILNIIHDITIYLLPFPMLWQLKMPMRQKLGCIAVSCVGSVAVIAGCVRFHYNAKLNSETEFYSLLADALNWCSIELYFAIMGGSASTFKALLKRWLPNLLGGNDSADKTPAAKGSDGYTRSADGTFAVPMKRIKPTANVRGGKQGLNDVTMLETQIAYNDSEEAIVKAGSENADTNEPHGIVIKSELRMDVSDAQSGDNMRPKGWEKW